MGKTTRIRLVEERKLRQWSQQEMADRLGTTRHNISRWEAGLTTPGPYFRAKLTELFGKRFQELGLLSEEMSPDHPSLFLKTPCLDVQQRAHYWHVPLPRNPFFTGRDQQIQQLHELLTCQSRIPVLSQSYALHGLGGIGKTQIALEYAYRYASAYTALLWVNAETHETLLESLVTLAEVLNLPERDEQNQYRVARAVNRWLIEQKDWLLICDNVEDFSLLAQLLPAGCQGALLITTRLQALGTSAHQLPVEPLTAEEGRIFLLQRAKLLSPGIAPMQLADTHLLAAQAIVQEMAGLPLALDQAGAYIEETRCSLEHYLHQYHQRQSHLLVRRGNNCQDHPASLQTTLSLSVQRVEQSNRAATEALRFCAFLAPDSIPEDLLANCLSDHFENDAWLLDEAIAVLGMYSLVRRDTSTSTLNIHRLVQAVVQHDLSRQEQAERVKRLVSVLNCIFPEVKHTTWKQCERLLSHVLQCAKSGACLQQNTAELASLLLKTGYYLVERGHYREAEPILQQALQIREAAPENDPLLIASALNALSLVYNWQGKYAQAEPLLQRALQIRELTPDVEYFEVARSLNNLGCHYTKIGKYALAEPLLLRAVRVQEQSLDNKLIFMLNNLADLYLDQEKYTQAEPLLQRAMQLEVHLEEEEPVVAYTLNNQGRVYAGQGKYALAEAFFWRALSLRESVLGVQHPHVAQILDDLIDLYLEQGRYTQVEPLIHRALSLREPVLGVEHPDVANCQYAFARFYLGQRNIAMAQEYYQQALATWNKTLSLSHPRVVHNLQRYVELMNELTANVPL